jgi:ABC-2 type transport system ATP-binding protein
LASCRPSHRPHLLILDEPSSGLDPLVQREFHALVRETAGTGGTAIAAGAGFAVVSYFIDSLAEITAAVRPWRLRKAAMRRCG